MRRTLKIQVEKLDQRKTKPEEVNEAATSNNLIQLVAARPRNVRRTPKFNQYDAFSGIVSPLCGKVGTLGAIDSKTDYKKSNSFGGTSTSNHKRTASFFSRTSQKWTFSAQKNPQSFGAAPLGGEPYFNQSMKISDRVPTEDTI
jgi:hypothetical protein